MCKLFLYNPSGLSMKYQLSKHLSCVKIYPQSKYPLSYFRSVLNYNKILIVLISTLILCFLVENTLRKDRAGLKKNRAVMKKMDTTIITLNKNNNNKNT